MKGTFRLFFESALFVLLFFSSAFLVQHNRIALADNPSISWSQQPLEVQVFPGTGKLSTISFTSNQNLSNVDLFIVPELQPYLTLSPQNFSNVSANTSNTVHLLITAPSSTALGTYKGTLHIRQDQKTIPETLKISINVIAPSLDVIPQEVALPSSDRVIDDLFVSEEIVIYFNEGVPNTKIKEIIGDIEGVFLGSNPDLNSYQVFLDGNDPNALKETISELNLLPEVDFATLNFFLPTATLTPNDPKLGSWVESNPEGNNWGQEFIKLPSAWPIQTGKEEIKIAVIDRGFSWEHEDLKHPNTEIVFNFVEDDHGTKSAGVIGAVANNEKGVAGVIWDKHLLLYGAGTPGTTGLNSQLTYKFLLDAAKKGVKVINLSASISSGQAGGEDNFIAIKEEFSKTFNKIQELGDVLIINAAGNCKIDTINAAPASLVKENNFKNNLLAVGASDIGSALSDYSNFGNGVELAAPAGNGDFAGECNKANNPRNEIFTTSRKNDDIFFSSYYDFASGTSIAAPFVTGLAGLIYSEGLDQNINLAASGVKDIIINGAKNGGTFATGPDGHQIPIINAFESLKLLQSPPSCTTPTDGMHITENTIFCPETYNLPNGISITSSNATLDCNGAILNGSGDQVGIGISGNKNITIRNCIVQNFGTAIHLGFFDSGIEVSGIIIENNTLTKNEYGIIFPGSPLMKNNEIKNNLIVANDIGFAIFGLNCFDNLIVNNFFDNTSFNAFDDCSGSNKWNISKTPGTNIVGGPFLGGNFWSDYAGTDTDSDGLGDTDLPYTSNGNIKSGGDFLPLVK